MTRLNHTIKFQINLEGKKILDKTEIPAENETDKCRAIFLLGLQECVNLKAKGYSPAIVKFQDTGLRQVHFIINGKGVEK